MQPDQKKQKKNHNPEANKTVEEIRELRAEKIKALQEAGSDPFAYSFDRTALAAELQERFLHIPDGEEATGLALFSLVSFNTATPNMC